jgi:SAM-dependent methyltransferase
MDEPAVRGAAHRLRRAGFRLDAEHGVWQGGAAPAFAYNDGDAAESYLLRVLAACRDLSVLSPELKARIVDWPSLYHLSSRRANLLRPFAEWLAGRSVLEIGAGAGAITRYLGEAGCDVLALEGSARRARMAALRCRDLTNVAVANAVSDDAARLGTFDAVLLIGVLEYARTVFGPDGFRVLLAQAAAALAPGGVLFLAIENQLGLRYLAGAPEDHLSVPMLGVEDLYPPTGVATLGRRELDALLRAAGFAEPAFHLPLPDYKLPVALVTARGWHDHAGALRGLAALAAGADAVPGATPHFSRELATQLAWRNGLAADLADSFLVTATLAPAAAPALPDLAAVWFGDGRRAGLGRQTRISCGEAGLRVEARRLDDRASPTAEGYVFPAPGRSAFLEGELEWIALLRIVNRRGWRLTELSAWAAGFAAALEAEAGGAPGGDLPGRFLDATPFNAVRAEDGGLRFFDLDDIAATGPVPLGYLLFRSLYHGLARARSVARPQDRLGTRLAALCGRIMDGAGHPAPAATLADWLDREAALQSAVTGLPRNLTRRGIGARRPPPVRAPPAAPRLHRAVRALRQAFARSRGARAP